MMYNMAPGCTAAPKDCFLDVGCGPGHVAISACLHHPTITAIGIDVRRDYLREAQGAPPACVCPSHRNQASCFA